MPETPEEPPGGSGRLAELNEQTSSSDLVGHSELAIRSCSEVQKYRDFLGLPQHLLGHLSVTSPGTSQTVSTCQL